MTLRPRPIDHLLAGETGLQLNAAGQWVATPSGRLAFPYPADATGDVKNLKGFPGGNDSIWIDLDYPVKTLADGTKYKPLFAFLIIDLDGRINLNAHGNVRGLNLAHLSNQGWGKWEVNLRQLVTGQQVLVNGQVDAAQTAALQAALMAEWPQLFVGVPPPANTPQFLFGKYGKDLKPGKAATSAIPSRVPRIYSQADFDSSNPDGQGVGTVPGRYALPGVLPGTAFASFPLYPPGFGNGSGGVVNTERWEHPLLYDPVNPFQDPTDFTNFDRRFDAYNLVSLMNGGPLNSNALSSDVGQLLPTNMGRFHVRNLLTTDSYAIDRAGLTPWLFDRNAVTNVYGYGAAAPLQTNPTGPPIGTPVAFPSLALRTGNVPLNSEFRTPGAPYFLPSPPAAAANTTPNPAIDWRSIDAALNKVDLNRYLPAYPHQGSGTTPLSASAVPITLNGANGLPDPNGRFDVNVNVQAQFLVAQQARQQFADDIYRRLLLVTGVPSVVNPLVPTAAELAPRRWLAQLAANIVDFIDDDEISTPFNFYTLNDAYPGGVPANPTFNVADVSPSGNPLAPNPELLKYWVFGTELPRVLLNEVLAEYQTPQPDPKTGKLPLNGNFPVKIFAELFNPLPNLAQAGGTYPNNVSPQDPLPVPLYVPAAGTNVGYSPYRVVVANTNKTVIPGSGAGGLLPPANINDDVLGTPEQVRTMTTDGTTDGAAGGDFGSPGTTQTIDTKPVAIAPAQVGIAPQQFVLVGPQGGDFRSTIAPNTKAPGLVPPGTPMMSSPTNLQYTAQITAAAPTVWTVNGNKVTDNTDGVTVLLRRLANPHLPPDNNLLLANGSLNPAFNPYVTVDYIQGVVPGDAAKPGSTYASRGKLQPYAAHPSQIADQVVKGAPPPNTVHTLGSQNNPFPAQYDWLVHLDRELISAVELLHVSGYHPHQLTHRFVVNGVKNQHLVNWYDERNRLYRAFEFLGTHDRTTGVSPVAGRVPGQVNLNAIWNVEQFRALCDAQGGNGFSPAVVDQVFQQLLLQRSPNGVPGPRDRPFLGMGIGNLPVTDPQSVYDDGTAKTANTGVEDTFFRSFAGVNDPTQQRLFDVPGAVHPYDTTELLRKIYGNVTTRSNVFAVWQTVGFFRVIDDTVRPVKLGEEIGAATNTNIRHRMFAVIDRSKLMIAPTVTTTVPAPTGVVQSVPGAAPNTVNVMNQPTAVQVMAVAGLAGNNTIPWQIAPGSVVVIDNGSPNEETVIVQAPPPGWVPPQGWVPPPPPPGQPPQQTYWIWATFQKEHGVFRPPPPPPGQQQQPIQLLGNVAITIPGNPGPQPTFSVSDFSYPGLVLAYAVLE
jgi:hypothetical protein